MEGDAVLSRVFLVAIAAIVLPASLVFAQPDNVVALCNDTLAALQKTDAAPLAKLLSVQAGTFLAVVGDKAIVLNADALADKDKWADKPLLSEAAKAEDVKTSDRLYAVRVEGKIKDGDATYLLDGVAVGEGDGLKWGMLAVVPAPDTDKPDEKARDEIVGLMSAWGQALAGGNPQPMLDSLSPDAMAFAVVGPDYGFYVFKDREDLKMTLEEAMAQGGLSVQFSQEPQVVVSGPAALLHGTWKLDVGGNAAELECWAHLERTEEGWRVIAFFALPPEQ